MHPAAWASGSATALAHSAPANLPLPQCNGSIACQLLDALHPGVVPMKKLDFNARGEYDCINNYKVLQEMFDKFKISKVGWHVQLTWFFRAPPICDLWACGSTGSLCVCGA